VLLGGSLAITVVPCLFIGRMRARLSAAERQSAIQLWHFRRLAHELIGAAPRR
jgi:hypothetical protein